MVILANYFKAIISNSFFLLVSCLSLPFLEFYDFATKHAFVNVVQLSMKSMWQVTIILTREGKISSVMKVFHNYIQ